MSSDNGKRSVTENFCGKISRSIWTQIKENGNNMRMKHYTYKLACSSKHESCLSLETRGKQGNRFENSTKLPQSSHMFFELSQLLHFFFALDAMQTNYCDENQQLQLGVRPLSQTVSC